MKTTYLIYKQIDGVQQLVAATQSEWDAIMKENRGLPMDKRRCFVMDCITDEGEMDCMYIEVPASEHKKWNSENTVRQRKRKAGKRYKHQSLDTETSDSDVGSLHESVPSDFDLESIATDNILIDELRQVLQAWKPWAEELLNLYISGAKRTCTEKLCKKYGLTDRAVRKRKKAFEKLVLSFLKK